MESQESKHPSLELADCERDREALRADCAAGFKIGNTAEGNEFGPYCRANIKIEPREPEDDLFKVHPDDDDEEADDVLTRHREDLPNAAGPDDASVEVHHPDGDDKEVASDEDDEEADDVFTMPPPLLLPNHEEIAKVRNYWIITFHDALFRHFLIMSDNKLIKISLYIEMKRILNISMYDDESDWKERYAQIETIS